MQNPWKKCLALRAEFCRIFKILQKLPNSWEFFLALRANSIRKFSEFPPGNYYENNFPGTFPKDSYAKPFPKRKCRNLSFAKAFSNKFPKHAGIVSKSFLKIFTIVPNTSPKIRRAPHCFQIVVQLFGKCLQMFCNFWTCFCGLVPSFGIVLGCFQIVWKWCLPSYTNAWGMS